MNQITKLEGATQLSKKEQKDVNGGRIPFVSANRRGCNPSTGCCYHNGSGWVQGPPCF